jgi:hypothetical protein
MGSCEHGYEPLDSIKVGTFFTSLLSIKSSRKPCTVELVMELCS